MSISPSTQQPPAAQAPADQQFTSYYLQRATREFAEDLDRVRAADDFKNDALPLLVRALQQGTSMFTPRQQQAIIAKGDEPKQG